MRAGLLLRPGCLSAPPTRLEEQMSNPRKRRPQIPHILVLAAVERAQLHRFPSGEAVPVWQVLEHLDLPRRSAAAREARAQIQALETAGALASQGRHGVQVWQLTPDGRRRLTRAHRRAEVPALPESPQHRRWRAARTLASREIDRFRRELSDALEETAVGRPDPSGCLLEHRGVRIRLSCSSGHRGTVPSSRGGRTEASPWHVLCYHGVPSRHLIGAPRPPRTLNHPREKVPKRY
jgi:hypothetical protein